MAMQPPVMNRCACKDRAMSSSQSSTDIAPARASRRVQIDATVRNTVNGWIDKASNQLTTAKQHAESSYRSSEAIQAAQECIELSVKSVLTLLHISYPRAHEWPADGKAF